MAKNAREVQNHKEIADFLVENLKNRGKMPDTHVAGNIVELFGNDLFDDWYAESKGDPDFVAIIDIAADLEVPNVKAGQEEVVWQQLIDRINKFVKKYGK